MKITKDIVINVSIDEAWKLFVTDFNDAHVWMASVYNSHERSAGGGRVCDLSTKGKNGLWADETINNVDEANHSFTFTVVAQNAGALPIKENENTITMEKLSDHETKVTWASYPSPNLVGKVLSPVLKMGLGKLFGDVLEEFKYFAETGTPHPRKVKALTKATT